jgi:hypothetical protein
MPSSTSSSRNRYFFDANQELLENALSTAVRELVESGATDSLQFLADHFSKQAAAGRSAEAEAKDSKSKNAKDSNSKNAVAFAMGVLEHKPPRFTFFESVTESLPLLIKEVKLPCSAQTHEVCLHVAVHARVPRLQSKGHDVRR